MTIKCALKSREGDQEKQGSTLSLHKTLGLLHQSCRLKQQKTFPQDGQQQPGSGSPGLASGGCRHVHYTVHPHWPTGQRLPLTSHEWPGPKTSLNCSESSAMISMIWWESNVFWNLGRDIDSAYTKPCFLLHQACPHKQRKILAQDSQWQPGSESTHIAWGGHGPAYSYRPMDQDYHRHHQGGGGQRWHQNAQRVELRSSW